MLTVAKNKIKMGTGTLIALIAVVSVAAVSLWGLIATGLAAKKEKALEDAGEDLGEGLFAGVEEYIKAGKDGKNLWDNLFGGGGR